ncbi:hypothetical protein SUGI_0731550 [Cryptomeria japonica]|uniref:uncharacterized protein LOC131856293 n=1 Tax=Cryptomeria japonica TaxID=3369 RepID=UPI002414A784|nr:uncharacterized protein LOC131856293 [Cryptomeria japonica]GLJ36431.1 hypothetical protein SUGI_0731550 [Cryptomeria japonica]
MDNYMYRPTPQPQEQQKELANCRKRNPSVEDSTRISIMSKKMKLHKNEEDVINCTKSSNCTSSQGHGSDGTNRSSSAVFNTLANASNANKSAQSRLLPSPTKAVNWRLACFLASEYLSRGTLLGKPWPMKDSNGIPGENATAQPKKKLRGDVFAREKEAIYSTLTANFLRSDDIQIPDIFNPSQLAAWLGFK